MAHMMLGHASFKMVSLIAACDEERWSKKKGQGGFPVKSFAGYFNSTGYLLDSIDRIADRRSHQSKSCTQNTETSPTTMAFG